MTNKVILIGNVGRSPEIKTMQSGDKVANFSLATSERWKDKTTGEKKENTEWHNIVVFSKGLVDLIENYITKGSKLYVEGAQKTRKYQDKNGNDRYTTEVVLSSFGSKIEMLDSRSDETPSPAIDSGAYGVSSEAYSR